MVSCNQSGTYLDNCPVQMFYNINGFGEYVADNAKINLTKGTVFNTSTYENPNNFIVDNNNEEIRYHLGLDYSLTNFNRIEVPTILTQMLHVKIEIASCGEYSNVEFINKSEVLNSLTYTTNASEDPFTGTYFFYDDINFGSGLTDPLCLPIIDNFNNNLRAGTGDILTIEGRHFGATRGNGQIKFKSADDGGNGDFIQKLDPSDYITWNDNQIEVIIPSYISTTTKSRCPGSGPFILYK